jgi:hypothetical protein
MPVQGSLQGGESKDVTAVLPLLHQVVTELLQRNSFLRPSDAVRYAPFLDVGDAFAPAILVNLLAPCDGTIWGRWATNWLRFEIRQLAGATVACRPVLVDMTGTPAILPEPLTMPSLLTPPPIPALMPYYQEQPHVSARISASRDRADAQELLILQTELAATIQSLVRLPPDEGAQSNEPAAAAQSAAAERDLLAERNAQVSAWAAQQTAFLEAQQERYRSRPLAGEPVAVPAHYVGADGQTGTGQDYASALGDYNRRRALAMAVQERAQERARARAEAQFAIMPGVDDSPDAHFRSAWRIEQSRLAAAAALDDVERAAYTRPPPGTNGPPSPSPEEPAASQPEPELERDIETGRPFRVIDLDDE